jgi:hypothetical protein
VANFSSGNLPLLKIIIRESHLDTNATTVSIRNTLSSLDTYIITLGWDITCFNGYVQLLIDSLAARGETTQDLYTNLFKGYQAIKDKVLVSYIGRKLEKYKEGEAITLKKVDNGMLLHTKKKRSWLFNWKWDYKRSQRVFHAKLITQLKWRKSRIKPR